jgi:hypothetical protein
MLGKNKKKELRNMKEKEKKQIDEPYCGFEYFCENGCNGCKIERFCEKYEKLIASGMPTKEARREASK